ncbi:ATP-binding cassette domain-containing protein [Permianibacter aggregans]|uniref:ATP-binding cassette domain-containing protein n=1 Tax=Permianibacter aggregans TaxID=1510150 RepID=UPI0012F7CCB0|nr:ATP-binding cassette domain-containing protein [Permianibacter aggregans]
MSIISTHLLCKDFGEQRAVDRLDLSVPAQSVYAFLGGNGAGKSTTIRLLLGLLTPSSGQVSLFGQTLTAGNRCSLLKRTGSLVESPSLYNNLSGRDNLRLNQRVLNCAPSNIDHVLQLMGLAVDLHLKLTQDLHAKLTHPDGSIMA